MDTLSTDYRLSGGEIEFQGFDFSAGRIKFAAFPSGFDNVIDLSMEVMVNGAGEAVGAKFFHTRPAYIDMGYLSLDQVGEAPADGYISELLGVTLGHTYCIITTEDKYAKIHIDDIQYGSRAAGTFAWIRFDWQFQPDGGRIFQELPQPP